MRVSFTSNIQAYTVCCTWGEFCCCSILQLQRNSRRGPLTRSFVAQQVATICCYFSYGNSTIVALLSNSSVQSVSSDLADLAGSKFVQHFARKAVLPTLLIARLRLVVVRLIGTLNDLSTATCPKQAQKL